MKRGIVTGFLFVASLLQAAPSAKTEQDFQRFISGREAARDKAQGALWIDRRPELVAAAKRGETVVRPVDTGTGNPADLAGGLAHDWIGTAFIPGATLDATLALVQDYNNHKHVYAPEVMDSRTVSHRGDDYHAFLRLRKQKIITVILNSEHDVKYTRVDAKHAYSRSYSTKISEIDNPGTANEHELSQADDHGFLWRLNSYWRFEERDGGVWIECEAISLTRDVPFGLGGLIKPIIRDLPAESLTKTLQATRASLVGRRGSESAQIPLASHIGER